ncbi:MAG: undecaprenyl-diphosphate phosphatase [Clostridia bacterium]|nr:undecaprenyl-diphosphate phosphatase [Clostridia bacterium]
MSILMAMFWGFVQGVCEFLPISSSGHLAILQNVFGMENIEQNYFTFDILLHLGTLIAVFIVYYKEIFALIPAFFTMLSKAFKRKFKLEYYNADERFVIFVIIATIPLVISALLGDYVETIYGYTKVIGAILIFNGIMLFVGDIAKRRRKSYVGEMEVKPRNALTVGLMQMFAVLPGLSRSGTTITGGLLCGYEQSYAVKFSFILSVPAILGANILSLGDLANNPISKTDILPYAIGALTAAVVGIGAMKLLIYISKKSDFRIFAIYSIIIGCVAVIFG